MFPVISRVYLIYMVDLVEYLLISDFASPGGDVAGLMFEFNSLVMVLQLIGRTF